VGGRGTLKRMREGGMRVRTHDLVSFSKMYFAAETAACLQHQLSHHSCLAAALDVEP